MSITGVFLRNRYTVWALVVAIVVLGLGAYRQIPVRLFPDTAPPLINVVTAWPGAAAADVDRDLSEVLETEFASLEGVASSSSSSQDNLSIIQIEFQYDSDVRLAAVDVQNAISRISDDLPETAQIPRVLAFSTADRPIYTVGIVADDLLIARRLAEDVIAPRLQAIKGVAAVDVFGGRVPNVFVDVDPKRAEAHHLALPQIAAAVRNNNVSMPAGRVRGEQTETMLRVDQRSDRVEDLEDIPLQLKDGSQLRLGTVAEVYRGAKEDDSWFSINGERAISVQIFRSEDANTVDVVELVRAAVADLDSEFPEVRFVEGEESASFTQQSVSNLLGNVWQALLLASVILFLFLGRARAALITSFTMPLSFGLTFAVMWKMGMEFNMVTLSAVILAVGMVVDASVVVLENIVRLRGEGLSAEDAARDGADQVWGPVLAGAATTLVVLIPLLSLQGFIGKVFGPLAMTLLIAFSSSVLVALILVPILSLQVREEGRLERIASMVTLPFRAAMDALGRGYIHVLQFGLRWRSVILVTALASFAGGIIGLGAVGMDLLPRMDGGTFTVSVETPSGTSLTETTKVVRSIEALLSDQPEVLLVQSQAGFEPGMKFSGGSGVMGPTQGFLSVTLSPRTERERSIWEIEEKLREDIAKIPGIVSVIVKEVGNTAKPTTLAPVVVRISGPDPLVLETLGSEVVQRLAEVEAIVDPTPSWRRDMRRILVHVDQEQAAAYGHSSQSIAQQLAMGAEGIAAGTWTPELSPAEPIEARYAPADKPDVDYMLSWPIFLPSGDVLPLRSVAHTETVVEQGLYSSVDLNPVLDIRAGVGNRPLNFVVADAEEAILAVKVPQGYTVAVDGENKDLEESRSSILGALSISILAVYLLLVAQFRSWVHPVTVMMAVPLSISGVALALWTVGKPVSMPVMVGLVLLVGTVVNNSILLVDVIRKRRLEGVPRREAITEGVRSRFRPIMMTSLSTVIGMLPLAMELALGAERFSPLAIAVIGGLLVSTLLTMVVIPVLYDLVDSFRWPFAKGGKPQAKAIATTLILLLAVILPSSASAETANRSERMSLADAWALTLAHPAAKGAAHQIEAAQAAQRAARQRSFPSAEVTGRISQLSFVNPALINLPITLPDGSMPEPVQLGESIEQQYSIGASLTQPLYTGGALTQGRRAATAGVRAAEAGKRATEAELWLALVKGWYGLATAEELVTIQQAQLDSAQAREASIGRLLAEGRATELEVSSVALKRAEAEQRLLEAHNSVVSATAAMEAFLGQPARRSQTDVLAVAKSLAPSSAEAISYGVQRAFAQAEIAEAKAKAARASLLPALALRLHAEYSNPNTRYFPVTSEFNGSWDASLVLSWKLDVGVTTNEAKRADLEASAAHAKAQALERQTRIELGEARAYLDLGPSQLRVAAERVELAGRAVAATERALAQGRATPTQVLEREAELGMALAAQQGVALSTIVATERARTLAGSYGPR